MKTKNIKFADFLETVLNPDKLCLVALKEYSCSVSEVEALVREFRQLMHGNAYAADKIVQAFVIGIKLRTLLEKHISVVVQVLNQAVVKADGDVTTAELLNLQLHLSEILSNLNQQLSKLQDKLTVSLDDYNLNNGLEYADEYPEAENEDC